MFPENDPDTSRSFIGYFYMQYFSRLYVFVSVTTQRSCKHQKCDPAVRTLNVSVCLSPVHIILPFCSSFPLSKPSELSLPIQSSTKAKNKKSGQEKRDGSRIHFPSDTAAGLIPAQRVLWSSVNEPSSLKDSPFLIYSYTRTIHLRTLCLLSLSAANSRPRCYI